MCIYQVKWSESEEFEDTKGVIRIRISKKNRQHNVMKIPKGGNQNPYIEEEQTTQWLKVQQDKQRSTKHTNKTKDRVTRTPPKTGGELMCFGRISRNNNINWDIQTFNKTIETKNILI